LGRISAARHCEGAHNGRLGPSPSRGQARAILPSPSILRRRDMRRKFATMTAGLAALALASLGIAPAKAVPDADPHAVAIKACSGVNPSQPVSVLNAVDDGSGIGVSLVWLTDKDNNLWMCDADAEGNVYSYTIVASDLLSGGGPELIGLQLASDGSYDG